MLVFSLQAVAVAQIQLNLLFWGMQRASRVFSCGDRLRQCEINQQSHIGLCVSELGSFCEHSCEDIHDYPVNDVSP